MTYKKLFSCEGKVALVTGGCGLIGSEAVRALMELGALVYIADTDGDRGDALADETGGLFIAMDIASGDSIEKGMDEVLKEEGRVDILVNSAYPRTGDWGARFEDISCVSWEKNVNDHLGGYFLVCRKAAEVMKKQEKGSIINLASIYGVVAPDFSIYEGTEMTMPAAYAAIKGGLISLTRYMATYYAPYHVRVNALSPGGVFGGQDRSFVNRYCERTPLSRMASPRDVAAAVIYLASDASSYITGQNLLVDGGWTAW